MAGEPEFDSAAEVLRAVASALRLKLLLLDRSPMTVLELTERLGESQPLVSHHLAVLRRAGLVWVRREGSHAIYSTTANPVVRLAVAISINEQEKRIMTTAEHDTHAGHEFGLLTGSIVSVDSTNLVVLGVVVVLVLGTLAAFYRPLLFASTDPDVAAARGVPTRLLSPLFAVLIVLTTAIAVPIVGAILVLAVSVIPGAAAARVAASPLGATVLAVLFAEVALLGGAVLSLAPGLPVSGYVATIAFLCYLGCRLVGRLRGQLRAG